jgi:hypothetical protein
MSVATYQLRELAQAFRLTSRAITGADGTIPLRTVGWLITQARSLAVAAELTDEGVHSEVYAEALFDMALERLETFHHTYALTQNGSPNS